MYCEMEVHHNLGGCARRSMQHAQVTDTTNRQLPHQTKTSNSTTTNQFNPYGQPNQTKSDVPISGDDYAILVKLMERLEPLSLDGKLK